MKTAPPALTAWISAYLDSLQGRGLADATQATYAQGLDRLLDFLALHRHPHLEILHLEELDAFQAWLLARPARTGPRRGLPLKSSSVALWLKAVRGLFRWLVKTGHRLTNPADGLDPLRVPAALPRILNRAEVDRLLAATSGPDPVDLLDRAILEVLYSSALRAGELSALDLSDVDLGDGELVVRRGKGRTSRRVPVGMPALIALREYLTQGRPHLLTARSVHSPQALWLSCWGTRLSVTRLQHHVRQRAQRAGLPGQVSPHTLRHTAAVHLLQGGASIVHIQHLLGHSSLNTTAHYTQLDLTDLKEALKRHHPRARLRLTP